MNAKLLLMATISMSIVTGAAYATDIPHSDLSDVPAPPVSITANNNNSLSVCDTAGTGYFRLPGMETCLRIGGRIDARFGYGRTKMTIGGVRIAKDSGATSRVEASFDFDTYATSDIGDIRTKVRAGLRNYDRRFYHTDNKDVGIELAYIEVGPAYIGYKDTLFNTKAAYGEYMNIQDTYSLNSLTAGMMMDDIGMGLYAGFAVEDWDRNQFIRSHSRGGNTPDFVARLGIADQSWGGSDLSFIYSDHYDFWLLKSTTDFEIMDRTQARFSASYGDVENQYIAMVTAGINHNITDKVSGFSGFGYTWNKSNYNAYIINAGVVYALSPGFDISGELGYTRFKQKVIDGKVDDVSATLRFMRTW